VYDEAVDLTREETGQLIHLRSGHKLPCRQAVLALGNFPPVALRALESAMAGDERYVRDPWSVDPWQGLGNTDTVLLVGSGLTMVDMVRSLHSRRHQGQIVAVSTHAELPAEHCPVSYEYPAFGQTAPPDSSTALHLIREQLQQAKTAGIGWHAVVDALRPDTASWWQALPLTEQQRFLRHLSHRWNIARHRMPPESGQIIREMAERGQLHQLAGRIAMAELLPCEIRCTVADRSGKEQRVITARRVINCTGPESNPRNWNAPLVQHLLNRGIIRPHANALGLDATPEGELINAQGSVSDGLLAIGPLLKGVLFESVAVPEIRQQAQQMAGLILSRKSEI
jgi:uncharacterized NAD(P)/FAD-binding protein YdhS